jgi:hypothetical protein
VGRDDRPRLGDDRQGGTGSCESVRRHLLDVLTPEQFQAFGEACIRVAGALRPSE